MNYTDIDNKKAKDHFQKHWSLQKHRQISRQFKKDREI